MPENSDDEKPWRRLYRGQEQLQEHQQSPEQHPAQQQQQEPEALTELQQQFLDWYRKTCLVTGAGMAGAVWHWYKVGKHKQKEVFIPPRAQALPAQHVEAYKQKAQLREAMRTIGRQSLFIMGVAALYFGVELGAGHYRETYGDWRNTAAAGAVAGSYLGARAPSSMRGRTLALGGLAGGLLGGFSGWCQQQLTELAEAANTGSSSSKTPS